MECVILKMDASARKENVNMLIKFVPIIETVTKKVGVNLNLDYVFVKILKDVFMVPNAKAIRSVAKEVGVILKLNCALDAGKDLNNQDFGKKDSC